MRLLTTTTKRPDPGSEARARAVAARLGGVWAPRRDSVARLLRRAGADLAYVVGRERVELRDLAGRRLAAHASTLRLVIGMGRDHPLIRAAAPSGAAPVRRIVDATLGLAKDALHLASVLECPVTGVERVGVLACLAEDGLARLARQERPWAAGAARVAVVEAEATAWLAAQPAASADLVFLDPMFRTPRASAAGFELSGRWPTPRR